MAIKTYIITQTQIDQLIAQKQAELHHTQPPFAIYEFAQFLDVLRKLNLIADDVSFDLAATFTEVYPNAQNHN